MKLLYHYSIILLYCYIIKVVYKKSIVISLNNILNMKYNILCFLVLYLIYYIKK